MRRSAVPVWEGAAELAATGCYAEGLAANREHPARELMWGAPGTLLAAVFLHERTRDAREEAQARTAAAAMRAADLREDIEQRLDEAKDELAERTRDAREEAASRRAAAARHAADVREDIQNRLDELQRRFDERASRLSRTRRSLLRGNPTARSAQYDAVLQKLKKHLER